MGQRAEWGFSAAGSVKQIRRGLASAGWEFGWRLMLTFYVPHNWVSRVSGFVALSRGGFLRKNCLAFLPVPYLQEAARICPLPAL